MCSSSLYVYPIVQRYYGKSLPFGDKSFVPSNIGYLSVEQALADYAMNIRTQRAYYPTITKVIAFGGRSAHNVVIVATCWM